MIHSARIGLAAALAALLAMALSAGLSGCANTAARSNMTETLQPDQGVVALRVVAMHERTLREVKVRNLATSEERSLLPQPELGSGSTHFMGMLPAGSYQTVNLQGSDTFDLGGMRLTKTLKVPLDAPVNRFEVAAGRLTNLGSILFAPVDEAAGQFVAPREDRPTAVREWLAYITPPLSSSLAPGADLGWAAAVPDRALVERQLAFVRSKATASSPLVMDAKGQFWAGGRMGLVAQWPRGAKAPVRWQTGTTQRITSVAPLADGRVLVAGEEGYVAVSDAALKVWKEAPAPVSRATTAMLVAQGPDGTVYLVSRTPMGAVVHAADPQRLAWRELKRQEREALSGTGQGAWVSFASLGQARAFAWVSGKHLVVYTPDPEAVQALDLQTQAWETLTPGPSVLAVATSPDGIAVVRNAVPSVYLSDDHARSWQKIDSFQSQTMPVFASRQVGYQVAKAAVTWQAEPPALFKTVDGGQHWNPVGAVPPAMDWDGQLVLDAERRNIGLVRTDGSVSWTADEGKTWR